MIVLDTNVISEAMRAQPAPEVRLWLNRQAAESLYLSSVTQAELLFRVGALPAGKRKDRLGRALARMLGLFPGRILAFDEDAAHCYAEMAIVGRASGRPLPMTDGYIAATAASRGFAVATRNVRDFQATGIQLINPWDTR